MVKETLTILVDADMFVFEACSSVEEEINWGDGLCTLHADANQAQTKVDDMVKYQIEKVLDKMNYRGQYDILMCFTDGVNFRKEIYPLYKANRIGKRKPVCYRWVKEWVEANYTTYQRPGLEADDCIGILATMKKNTVIISGDKDFKSIPGLFFDYRKGELHDVTEMDANRWHMYQTLIGDTADNYPGCPGIGEKTAEKLMQGVLDECTPWANQKELDNAYWRMVITQFEKKGLTEADALLMARVSRILRKSDYDLKTKQPILWNPS